MINGIKAGEKYSEAVRQFCFSISYHSPAAYKEIRKQFNNNLPHPKTLKTWLALSDLQGKPGVTEESLSRLKGFVEAMKGERLVCAVIFDEMYIRKQVLWDENTMQYTGFITYGMNVDHAQGRDGESVEKLPVAGKSMIFMLSGINKHFQFPVAYHFVDDLSAEELAPLASEVIIKVSQCGVKIANLVFDGDKKNIKMCKILGANLNLSDPNFSPYIESPYDKSRINLILDAAHMEKLMRNLLGNHNILFDKDDNKIEWKYFVKLVELSRESNILKTHKLTRKHIEFDRNKMNVRLAAETFSTSVADTFTILREQGHTQFIDSQPTGGFTYNMDKLFDILNSRNVRSKNAFKNALSEKNKQEIFEFLVYCKDYLMNLKMLRNRKKVNVYKTINGTPILGFIMDITSLQSMYMEYIEETLVMKEIRTYSFSQDHLEIFHAKLRARNGHNDNPNVVQFVGAYRRLLCNLDINAPEAANCMELDVFDSQVTTFAPQSNIYFISSRRPKLNIIDDEIFQYNLLTQKDDILAEVDDLNSLQNLDGLVGASIAYAARMIEERIESQEFYCDCCKYVFAQNEKLHDSSIYIIASKRPCESTFYICKIVDRFVRVQKPSFFMTVGTDGEEEEINRDFRVIFYLILKEIDFNHVFQESDFVDHEEHKFHLVRCIVREYIRIKTLQISKQFSLGQHQKLLRSKLTKWIHFCGQ